MFYNSYAKKANELFGNKVTVVTCPEDVGISSYNLVFAIPVFLAGGVIPDNDWRDEVIAYFKENWTHNKGIVFFSPVRPTCNFNDIDDLRKQIEWEQKYINHCGMLISFYFPDSQYHQPMSFYELGRCIGKRKQDPFGNWLGNDVFISVNKNYFRKNDVIIQTEVAKAGKNAKEVESVAEFAKHLMCYLEENYDLTIPMESTPDRCCGRCKNFKVYPTHGSLDLGYCTLKTNNEKVVNEDGLCEQFEKEDEK